MGEEKLTPDVLGAVAVYIGGHIQPDGNIEGIDSSRLDTMTWEDFVLYVYDYMTLMFIIEQSDIDKFSDGIKWIVERKMIHH